MHSSSFSIYRSGPQKFLAVRAPAGHPVLASFEGETQESDAHSLVLCPLNSANAAALRRALPNLQPVPLGLETSAGFGDRLGLATPGHAAALQKAAAAHPGAKIAPIFAQQSIRENARTGRTPQQVLDDATWGAFEAGWDGPLGADADHLKTTADIDACAAAGYSFFTLDPGDHVDPAVTRLLADELERRTRALPWEELDTSFEDQIQRYAGRQVDLEQRSLRIEREDFLRAAALYGRALAHIVRMYHHLQSLGIPFELEISVDETDTPTPPKAHYWLASELRRLGVQWVSLAPRFVGRFEKGVDYIGDPAALDRDLSFQAEIARVMGPYKLSLHSGSDKFSVYPLAAKHTRGLVHLKTAGTSYLEALRVVAAGEPDLFRAVLDFARARYPEDRATYHVSARFDRVPPAGEVTAADLPALLNQFDARQVLHVTFGSVLDAFNQPLFAALTAHEAEYKAALERHFLRHLEPFL